MTVVLAQAVEVAETHGWVEDGVLVVWDVLKVGRGDGTRLEVRESDGGYGALCKDGVGRAFSTSPFPTKLDAARAALDGYLSIVNAGV